MPNIATAAYYNDSAAYHGEIHYHNEYELIYVLEGNAKVRVADASYIASENHLILISNLEQHSVKQLTPVYRRYCVTLDVPTADSYLSHTRLLSLLKNHPQGFSHVLDIAPFQKQAVEIFSKMIAYNTGDDYANDLIVSCVMELLALLCKHNPHRFSVQHSAAEDKILAVQQYIDQNFKEQIKIDDLAKQFFISNCYLSHKFRELTGLSPKQYLMSVRLKNASVLLLNTDRSVSEISEAVGFSNHSNFIKSFKKIYRVLPKDFRQNQRKRADAG